jgi:hypothetical protein
MALVPPIIAALYGRRTVLVEGILERVRDRAV